MSLIEKPVLVYEDELVQLWHGDYRNGMELLTAERPSAIITDPPYGETNLGWDRWVDGWLEDASAIADALWCFGSFRMFHDHADEFRAWKYSQDVVWEKHNGSGMLNDRFRRVHEHAVLWYQGEWSKLHHETPVTHDAVKRTMHRSHKPAHLHGETSSAAFNSERGGPRLMRSVIPARNEHHRAVHPTQKPLGIVSPLIEYSTPGGGLVVDLFAGSGTTALAARLAGRRCIAFEAHKPYALAAAQRLSQQNFDLGAVNE
jgi:site-specific DNA-methyltransferase (adenine-specific)